MAKSSKGLFALATCKVTGACPAVALCEGGKTLPSADRSEGALTILRSVEIASYYKISQHEYFVKRHTSAESVKF